MSGERSEGELWQRLYELSDKLGQNRRSQTERWIRLRDRVESIEQEVNMMENKNRRRGSDSSSENNTNMDNIQSDIDLLKQEIKQLKQSHEESVELRQEFNTRIEELEQSQETIQSRIDDEHEEYTELRQEFNRRIEELEQSQETTQSRVDDEFDSIENAFETALARQEKFETRRSQLTDQIEDNADTIDSMSEDRESLEVIRQTALEEGVENAKCDYCGEDIKISMLVSPECPFCETPLNDVDPGGWNPLNSDVLTGAPRDLSADESEEFNSFLDESTDTNGIS